MKTTLAALVFVVSASAFATDFHAKIDDVTCKIENGHVTRTTTFGKETLASYTETKTVKMEGLAPFIEKAILTAGQIQPTDSEYVFSMKHEGKTYFLSVDDSRESQGLIRMISRICR